MYDLERQGDMFVNNDWYQFEAADGVERQKFLVSSLPSRYQILLKINSRVPVMERKVVRGKVITKGIRGFLVRTSGY